MTAISHPHLCDLRLPGNQPALPLAFEQRRIRIRLTHRKPFPFLHGALVHGLLCNALGRHMPDGLVPVAPETGRLGAEAGETYDFGLRAIGEEAIGLLETMAPALRHAGARWSPRARAGSGKSGPRPTFAGNFVVDAVESVETRPAAAGLGSWARAVDRLAAKESVPLRFLTPLRQKRPKGQSSRVRNHLDAECFPAGHFLLRLWQRWHLLAHGRYPKYEELPALPTGLRARSEGLRWVDMPVRGRPGAPGRAKGMTLGGAMGEVELVGLPRDWLALLVAMEPFHAGSSTHFGFGRYTLGALGEPDPFPPTSTLLAEALERKNLFEAVDRERSALIDVDFSRLFESLERIRKNPEAPPYEPHPWTVIDGRATPSPLDRVLQRAITRRFGPRLDAVRITRSRHRELWPARKVAFSDLETLLPREPAVSWIRQWLDAPVELPGLGRIEGPVGNVVGPLGEWMDF